MKKTVFTFLFSLIGTITFAQLTAEQRIQDSVIGWWNNNKFDNSLKPATDPIQKKRIDITTLFVDWMKKSYTPVGGLGTATRQNFAIRYGVYFMVWNVTFSKEYLDEKGHFKPIDEENTPFGISVNNIPASYAVKFLNGSGNYYFTWPPDGFFDWDMHKGADPRIHTNVYKYITRINEVHSVFLAPNNKLPFVEVTKGEYLDGSEASLDREFQNKKEQINGQWSNTKSRENAYQFQQKEFDRYRNAIHKWKEKYKDRLNEPAVLHNMQPTIISDFFGDMDPFAISDIEKSRKQYFPLYKVPADVMLKCKTAQPQWIAVWFRYNTKENGNQLYEMYTAITQNLNYDYIYNYFFDPEKVKGIAYKPANEMQLSERLNKYRKKNTASAKNVPANTVSLPSNVFFTDDFSGSNEGSDPANWYFKKFGEHSTIASVKGKTGKWIKIGYNNAVSPALLKKPLPENFSIEYDIATDSGFSSRTGGSANLILNTRPSNADGSENTYNNGTRVVISIQPGNEANYENDYKGIVKIDVNSSPSVNKQNYSEGISYTYPLREFTNKKASVHVGIKLQGGVLKVLINNQPVAVSTNFKLVYGGDCISCGVPAGTKFNAIYWNNITNNPELVNVYISNIKIIKE